MVSVQLASTSAQEIEIPALVLFLTQEQAAALPLVQNDEAIKEDFKGKAKQVFVVYSQTVYPNAKRLVLVGLGEEQKVKILGIRHATHEAVQAITKLKIKNAAVAVPTVNELSLAAVAGAIANTAVLSDYAWKRHITVADAKPNHLASLTLLVDNAESYQADVDRAVVVANGTVYARNVANERADDAHPAFFEEQAKAIALEVGNLDVTVLQYDDLVRVGCNLLAAVGQSSTVLPRLVFLDYNGAGADAPKIAFVGKGITFDTGGLNLKPTGSMETMYMDKHGACTVLGLIKTIATLKLKVNVLAVLSLAENSIDGKSYKPSAIIQSYKGLTVEIGNTDAEGRLALADAISYSLKNFQKIDTLVDLATLTGACVIALGEYSAGLFSNNDTLAQNITESSARTNERVWRMPVLDEHREEMKGKVSDLKSMGKGRYGGACTAAAFLENFLEQGINWAHIDIAGPAMTSEPRSYVPANATGFGVELLIDYLENYRVSA